MLRESLTTNPHVQFITIYIYSMLEEELKATNTKGQLSTVSGEEILCTTSDIQETNTLNQLTNAFVESDTLANNLKLGSIKQIINCTNTSKYSVQSKVEDEGKNNGLLTTVIGDQLDETLVGDGIMKQTAETVV